MAMDLESRGQNKPPLSDVNHSDAHEDSHSNQSHELTDCVTEEGNALISKDEEWTTKTLKVRADHRMKERLQRHFQDHIQKWARDKHPRFPWKAVLHLLLVVFVTVQVS